MKRLTLIWLSLSLFASCKKDKTCQQDMAGISGTYKVTAMLYKANSTSAETDVFVQEVPDACDRDDTYNYKSNGTYVFTDAGIKCAPPNDDTGTWSVNGNTFLIDGFASTIQSFDCSNLVFIKTDNYVVGDQMRVVFTRQ